MLSRSVWIQKYSSSQRRGMTSRKEAFYCLKRCVVKKKGLPTVAAAAAAAMPAAAFTRGHWTGLSDGHIPAAVFGAIELLNGVCRLLIGRHLNETETLASTRVAISNNLGGLDGSRLSEDFLKSFIRRVERKVADV